MPNDFVKDEFGQEVRVGYWVITYTKSSAKTYIVKEVKRILPNSSMVEIEVDNFDNHFVYPGNNKVKLEKRNIFIKASSDQITAYENIRQKRKDSLNQIFKES